MHGDVPIKFLGSRHVCFILNINFFKILGKNEYDILYISIFKEAHICDYACPRVGNDLKIEITE